MDMEMTHLTLQPNNSQSTVGKTQSLSLTAALLPLHYTDTHIRVAKSVDTSSVVLINYN